MPHAPIRHRARRLVIGLLVPLVALAAACQPAPTDPPPLPAGSLLATAGVALPAAVAAALGLPAGTPVPIGIAPPA